MLGRIVVICAIGGLLAGCASRPTTSGNDIGGVVDWSLLGQGQIHGEAAAHCGRYGKRARVKDIRGEPTNTATFDCV